MTNTMTVSVVVPVYNVALYVERCVGSVINQTYRNIECILVDDASSDDSMILCEKLIKNYQGTISFKLLHHEQNRGISAARNTGINATTGEYVLFLDSDDELTEDCVEKMVSPLLNDRTIDMVMGNFHADYSELCGNRSFRDRDYRFVKDEPLEIVGNEEIRRWYYSRRILWPDQVWNKLLKLSFIKENGLYNKEGQLFEDILWNYYVLRSINHVVLIPNITYLQYRRPSSIMTGTKYNVGLRHYGFIYREMAEHIVPGDRIEETERWAREFAIRFVDARDNPDYQYAYNAFLQQLETGRKGGLSRLLKLTKRLSSNVVGRSTLKSLFTVQRSVLRLIGFCMSF